MKRRVKEGGGRGRGETTDKIVSLSPIFSAFASDACCCCSPILSLLVVRVFSSSVSSLLIDAHGPSCVTELPVCTRVSPLSHGLTTVPS